MKKNRIVYSINVEDLLEIAENDFSIELNDDQIKSVEDKLGNYIDWYEAVYSAIEETVGVSIEDTDDSEDS